MNKFKTINFQLRFFYKKCLINEIVSAKETLKYLLENGKNLDDLNDNIKANHFQYDLDPLYLLKIKYEITKIFKG